MNAHETLMKVIQKTACAVVITACELMISTADAAILYFNDFDSVSFPNASAQFTLDAGSSELDFVEPTGPNLTRFASVALSDVELNTSDFVVSTRFTINNNGSVGSSGNSSIGFGLFGTSSTFPATAGNPNYLADWTIFSAGAGTTFGSLRILSQVDVNGFSAVNGDSDGANDNGSSIVNGATYELKLTGTYSAGTLNMTLAVLNELGNQLGTAATATDTSPLTGDFFGYRNRIANGSTNTSLSYDNFRVEVIPEPISLALAVIGALGIFCRNSRNRSGIR